MKGKWGWPGLRAPGLDQWPLCGAGSLGAAGRQALGLGLSLPLEVLVGFAHVCECDLHLQ